MCIIPLCTVRIYNIRRVETLDKELELLLTLEKTQELKRKIIATFIDEAMTSVEQESTSVQDIIKNTYKKITRAKDIVGDDNHAINWITSELNIRANELIQKKTA